MPFAILKSIYAVNNEDSSHPASSLLKNESNKKWKTSSNEKSAYVIIQLENELKIIGVDIGNEHSAFVEVLVGRTKKPDEFKEILLTSSFMTPIESKNSSNNNRVRCFSKEQLIESVANEKWDLVKFVCTQPFNKYCQYGLSFVKIHVAESVENKPIVPEKFLRKNSTDNKEENSPSRATKFLGKFKLREESPDSDSENTTSLFNRWKHQSKTPENQKKTLIGSTAAAIREASTQNSLKRNAECLKPTKILKKTDKQLIDVDEYDVKKPVLDRNRNDLLYNDNDDQPNDKFERRILLDKERIAKEKEKHKTIKLKENQHKETSKKLYEKTIVQKPDKDSSFASSKFQNFLVEENDNAERELLESKMEKPVKEMFTKKRISSPIKQKTPAKRIKNEKELDYKPFNKLLQGVVLTISGIQNPDRADIRSKALAMGAKYKPDWDTNCTHLICAFKNTPKYLQVQQADGKIITRKWIETCYQVKKRLPWRRYALDKSEIDKSESEEEILDIRMRPTSPESLPLDVLTPEPSTSTSTKICLSPPTESRNNRSESEEKTVARYDLGLDDDLKDETYHILSSGSDTEDEIEKILQKQKVEKTENGTGNIKGLENVFEVSTEEEEFTKKRHQQKESKYFFNNKKFYLTSKLNAVDKIKLKTIIEQYRGELIESLRQANYIISNESLEITNIQGLIVSPLWVYECNDMECLIPTNRYLM